MGWLLRQPGEQLNGADHVVRGTRVPDAQHFIPVALPSASHPQPVPTVENGVGRVGRRLEYDPHPCFSRHLLVTAAADDLLIAECVVRLAVAIVPWR